MTFSVDISNDLQVLDNLEAVTLRATGWADIKIPTALNEPVQVVADTYSIHASPSWITYSAITRSAGEVTLRLTGLPITSLTLPPIRRTSEASSVPT